ncbi:1,6-anhydro-N-acetylmuramyl-L-alanine amidase AmpD [Sutterella sp.]|uniref:1,6-anhydro-N-acetylmuramyl-L-alanine amidase AmpD n=1 Tax=Sutterella sp. TaxID=1981025 RepID=UPI0026E0701D|nr:1,6-anhydro-N-acetylmuramyl-L-alanine amidase AmpD [Sutterella sp.]MDO5531850.1 1,6-anhydro-N-acetylmuramyl-L-alanine amidase AmpD [Sutterella sp.]
MTSYEEGWLPGLRHRESPHRDERPAGDAGLVTLAVVHFISLPAGEFGGPAVDDLFMGTLDTAKPGEETLGDLMGLRVSSHFLIRRTGETIQYVNVFDRAWHAGLSNFRGRNACNDFSVGIELEGTGEVPFEDVQYAALGSLMRRLGEMLPITHVTGHETIAPGRKSDPGPFFDWERLRGMLPARMQLAIAPGDCDRGMLARRIEELTRAAQGS